MNTKMLGYVSILAVSVALSQVHAVCKKPNDKKQPESCVQFWSTLREARSIIEGTPSGKRLLGALEKERVSIVADPIESPSLFSSYRQLSSIGRFNVDLNRIEVRTYDSRGPIEAVLLASLLVHEAQHASDRWFINVWLNRLPASGRSAIGRYFDDLRRRRISFDSIPRADRAAIVDNTMMTLVVEARAYLAQCEFHDAAKDWSGSEVERMSARETGPDGARVSCANSRLVAELIIEGKLAVGYEVTGTLTDRQLAVAYCYGLDEPLKDPSQISSAIRDAALPPGCFLAKPADAGQAPEAPGKSN